MSIFREVDIGCPRCGNKENGELWDLTNVKINQEVKVKLLEGKINRFQRSCCSHEADISADLMYHDMDKEFCVCFYTFESMADKDFYNGFTTTDGRLQISEGTGTAWLLSECSHSIQYERTIKVRDFS